MKKVNQFYLTLIACVMLLNVSAVVAQDWPQWRGLDRDGKVSDFSAPEAWPEELKMVWQKDVGLADASPALLGDKLYLFTRQEEEEVILCLNVENGDEIWRDSYKTPPADGPARSHPGPRSTPTVTEGKVVTLGVRGILSCLNAADGKVLWRKNPFPEDVPTFYTSMSPLVADGIAVAHLGGPDKGALIAYDLNTGEEKWRWSEEGPSYASPVLLTVDDTKQVVTFSEKSILGIGLADGNIFWKLPFEPQRRAYNAATPILEGQMVIYTGADRGAKAVRVEKQDEGFSVKELWSNDELAPQFNSPVLKDGYMFGLSNRNRLYCINAQSGETAWTAPNTQGGGGFGSLVDAGSVLVLLTNDSVLTIFDPNEKEYSEIAQIKVAETTTYAHPILSGTRIFVKDENMITLYSVE